MRDTEEDVRGKRRYTHNEGDDMKVIGEELGVKGKNVKEDGKRGIELTLVLVERPGLRVVAPDLYCAPGGVGCMKPLIGL